MEIPSPAPIPRRSSREVRLPPLPPGLEVYRPAEVLGSVVLVVEDETAMQQQLRIDLHDLGYHPLVSSSAPDAMDLLERERIAGVLLDLVLDESEESGFNLLTWIRVETEKHEITGLQQGVLLGLPALVRDDRHTQAELVHRPRTAWQPHTARVRAE